MTLTLHEREERLSAAYRQLGEMHVLLERERTLSNKVASANTDLRIENARLLLELRQAREALDHQRKRNRELRTELRCRQEGETR